MDNPSAGFDWLYLVKVASALMSASLGVIGTIKDYTGKHAKRWKALTLVGVVCGGALSLVIENLNHSQDIIAREKTVAKQAETAMTLDLISKRAIEITQQQADLGLRQTKLLSNVNQLTKPIAPVGFTFTLHYPIDKNPCLRTYWEDTKQSVQTFLKLNPGSMATDSNDIVIPGQSSGTVAYIGLASGSKYQSMATPGWFRSPVFHVRFHPRKAGKDLVYYLDFSPAPAAPSANNQEMHIRSFSDTRSIRMHYSPIQRDDPPPGVSLTISRMGAEPRDRSDVLFSIEDLLDTSVELDFLGSLNGPDGKCGVPILQDFQMLWGYNYLSVTRFKFDAGQFKSLGLEMRYDSLPVGDPLAGFVHNVLPKDFGMK